jgi:hypothetical protein
MSDLLTCPNVGTGAVGENKLYFTLLTYFCLNRCSTRSLFAREVTL